MTNEQQVSRKQVNNYKYCLALILKDALCVIGVWIGKIDTNSYHSLSHLSHLHSVPHHHSEKRWEYTFHHHSHTHQGYRSLSELILEDHASR